MRLTPNRFRERLRHGPVRYGIFVGLGAPVAAEIVAGAGFDWLMLDAEHAPNDPRAVLHQLQAVAAYDVDVVVRPNGHAAELIKQLLDVGARSLVVPMVDTAEQADAVVRATRYPPHGVRGVGTALARAAGWGRVDDYFQRADEEMCVVVQVESRLALDQLDEIARVDGVDAVFVGPSDLAASLGHLGEPGHPDVRAAVTDALGRVAAAGSVAGVYGATPELADEYVGHGARFVAVGVDTVLLARASSELARRFHGR